MKLFLPLLAFQTVTASLRPVSVLGNNYNEFANDIHRANIADKLEDITRAIKEGSHVTSQMTSRYSQDLTELNKMQEARHQDLEMKLTEMMKECHGSSQDSLIEEMRGKLSRLEERMSLLENENKVLTRHLNDLKNSVENRTELSDLDYKFVNISSYTVAKQPLDSEEMGGVRCPLVAFDAYRNKPFHLAQSYINFDGTNVNVGNAFNMETGTFKAPVAGIYAFSFHGLTQDGSATYVKLIHNGRNVGGAYRRHEGEEEDSTSERNMSLRKAEGMLGQSVILDLAIGDEVRVYAYHGNLRDGGWHYTHFSGFLIS